MNKVELQLIKERLTSVVMAVRNQNSGTDVHEVGNIRNTAGMLLEQLNTDPECISDDLVNQITKNVEARLVSFYVKKYTHHWSPKDQ